MPVGKMPVNEHQNEERHMKYELPCISEHIQTWTKFIFIVGMIGSVLAFAYSIYLIIIDYHIFRIILPVISIVYFVTQIIGYTAFPYQKPNLFIPALISMFLLGLISMLLTGLLLIASVSGYVKLELVIFSVILFVTGAYNLFGFAIVRKMRRNLLKLSTNQTEMSHW